jgi:hypothetical protein
MVPVSSEVLALKTEKPAFSARALVSVGELLAPGQVTPMTTIIRTSTSVAMRCMGFYLLPAPKLTVTTKDLSSTFFQYVRNLTQRSTLIAFGQVSWVA